jgi:hypothetical protein
MLTAQLSPPLHIQHASSLAPDRHDRARLQVAPDASAQHPGVNSQPAKGGSVSHRRRHVWQGRCGKISLFFLLTVAGRPALHGQRVSGPLGGHQISRGSARIVILIAVVALAALKVSPRSAQISSHASPGTTVTRDRTGRNSFDGRRGCGAAPPSTWPRPARDPHRADRACREARPCRLILRAGHDRIYAAAAEHRLGPPCVG